MYLKQSLCLMYSLFLDHSFRQEVLALFKDGVVVQEICLDYTQGDHPCFFWDKMLSQTGCLLDEIDFFVCGVGPGSYTGMRGAAAVVKAVSLVQKKPIIAVSSLLLLFPQKGGDYLLIKDAKISGFYAQIVRLHDGLYSYGRPEIVSKTTLNDYLLQGHIPLCEASDSAAVQAGAIPVQLQTPTVALYAFESFRRNDLHWAENLPLCYLRKTQAEMELQKRASF